MLDKIPVQLRFGLIAAFAAAIGLMLGVVFLKPTAVSIESGTLLQPPRELPAFALTDIDGKPFTNANLGGHWTVVFAGFTTCPDVCPTTLSLMKGVMHDLGPLADQVQMVLLSIDPERDTPEKLKSYVHYFDPRFTGATGPNSELDKLARAMSFVYTKVPGATPETYTMDHSAALMLINPQGQLAGFFTAPHRQAALVADLTTLIKKMTDASLGDRAFAAVQQLLPTRALSSGMHALTRIEKVWFKDAFIRIFMRLFNISLNEAVVQDPKTFKSFNEFFTRALKPEARTVDASAQAFVSPVDGTVSQFGDITGGELIQAKGHTYSAETLLAGRSDWAAEFAGGQFITIYLAPYNYHRIHMPLKGTLREWACVPGRLFSVNHATARALPGVFARNERVVAMFDTELGPMAMVLVGALFVGSMETVWAGEISPPHVRDPEPQVYTQTDTIALEKGMEMGRFNMGSTVILLTPKKLGWRADLASKQPVVMGERIANIQ